MTTSARLSLLVYAVAALAALGFLGKSLYELQPYGPGPVQLEVHFARSPEYISPEHKTYTRWEIHTRPGSHTSQEILEAILEMDAQLQEHAAAY